MKTLFFFQILKLLSENVFENDLQKLTHEIVEIYFKRFRCLTYITTDMEISWPIRTDIPVINIDLTEDESQVAVDFSFSEGCGGYVIRSHPEKKKDIILNLISSFTNSTRYSKQFYFYLPYDEKDGDVSVLNAEKMFFAPNFVMVTVFDSKNYFKFSLWSHNYFHGHKYDVMKIRYEIIDYWTSKSGFQRVIEDIYFDKLKNVHGKLIMMGLMIHYPVYTVIVEEGNKTVYDGMETRLATLYVEKINGTWDATDHPDQLWGNLYPDGHADGILGSTMYHRVDMGFAAFYQTFCDLVACSYPYAYPGVTCMVPRPKKTPGWMNVILSFTPVTWAALFFVYVISSIIVFYATTVGNTDKIKRAIKSNKLFNAFFINFRIQIGQIPKLTGGEKTSLRIYLKFANIYYFFVANCWIGGIASILAIPRFEKAINTVSDLIEKYPKIKWGADASVWIESIRPADQLDLKFMVDKFLLLDEEILRQKTKTGDFAFFIERLPNGHFGMNDYIDEESLKYLKIMEGYVYHDNPVIIYPKGSPYQEPMDKMIFRLFDMGIIIKLETQVALERVNTRFQNLIRTSTQKPVKEQTSLQLRHLEGAVFIYIGGVIFSTFIFLIELSYYKLKNKVIIKI